MKFDAKPFRSEIWDAFVEDAARKKMVTALCEHSPKGRDL